MRHFDDTATARANQLFIRTAMSRSLLDRQRERELLQRWQEKGDQAALHELIEAHVRQVVAFAGKFRNYGIPSADLIQEGNIGLMLAADRFDLRQDVRFSTYASWWIRAAMQEYVLRNWSIVRTGTTAAHRKLFFNLRRVRARIADPSCTVMSEDECAEIGNILGLKARDVAHMEQRILAHDQSLNLPVGDDADIERQDMIADSAADPETEVAAAHDTDIRSRWLAEALGELPDRERWIISQRRLSERNPTLEELGIQLGVSKERVRQLEARALNRLREMLDARPGEISDLMMAG